MDKQQEDPELDFTNYLEKQKEKNTAANPFPVATEAKTTFKAKPMPKMMIRGIIFFVILLALMGVLIFLYMNRPQEAALQAPEGYRVINESGVPPRIEKIK